MGSFFFVGWGWLIVLDIITDLLLLVLSPWLRWQGRVVGWGGVGHKFYFLFSKKEMSLFLERSLHLTIIFFKWLSRPLSVNGVCLFIPWFEVAQDFSLNASSDFI